jgi:flagellar protein FliL
MATTEQAPAAPKGPSLLVQLAVLLVLTGAAVGAGFFAGGMLGADSRPATEQAAHEEAGHAETAPSDAERGVVALPAITTNIAAPESTWIRLELSAVFEGEPEPSITDAVHQDLLAFLRTVKLHQVEGASGFLHLKADLEERARIRSEGKVSALLIRTMLFE